MHRFYLSFQLELSIIQTVNPGLCSRLVDWNGKAQGLKRCEPTPFQSGTEGLLSPGSERSGGNRSPIPLAAEMRGPAGRLLRFSGRTIALFKNPLSNRD